MEATTEPKYRISPEDLADHLTESAFATDLSGRVATLEIRGDYISRIISSRGSYYAPGHGPDASAIIPEIDGLKLNLGDTLEEFARANVLPDDLSILTRGDIDEYAREVAAIILDGLHATDTSASLLRRDMTDDGDLIEAEINVEVDVAELRNLLIDGLVGATREWIARHPGGWGAKSLAQLRELMLVAGQWDNLDDLPTYGGSDAYGDGVWSWDEASLLRGYSSDDLAIVARAPATPEGR